MIHPNFDFLETSTGYFGCDTTDRLFMWKSLKYYEKLNFSESFQIKIFLKTLNKVWAHRNIETENFTKISYLKFGAGKPWALHDNSNGLFSSLVIEMLFISLANAGAFDPMGSVMMMRIDSAIVHWDRKKKETAAEDSFHIFVLPKDWHWKRLSLA